MLLAVPLTGNRLTTEFGRCDGYLFVTIDPVRRRILDSRLTVSPPQAPDHLPDWVARQGADVVLVPCGVPAEFRTMLEFHGLKVVEHTMNAEPDVLIKSYLDGTMTVLAKDQAEGAPDS